MKNLYFKNNDAMPVIGLGTWKSKANKMVDTVRKAIEIGYRHIDCAAIYGNEKQIGTALSDAMANGDVKRSDLWITSKLWNNSHRKDHVETALRKTLADLQIGYLDLYLMHWPVAFRPEIVFPSKGSDLLSLETVPLIETWNAMRCCADKGLVRHVGVSNFSIKKLDALIRQTDTPPEVNQVELHPYLPQDDMVDFCRKNYIHLTAYAPLGSSDRPSALKRKEEPSLLENDTVKTIAQGCGCTPAQLLIAWALHRSTSVIPKSIHPQRLEENLKSMDVWIAKEDMKALAALENGWRYVRGDFFTMEGSPYTLGSIWDR
jgi:alcohol dehydrogenase (NADP+)